MVYFTCDACGEQLKKPSVEKHYTQKCRQCTMLTCIDCLKDFYGDEYKSHNSCMSEEQRYSKEGRAGWDPEKGQGNKGEKRQNSWTANLRAILAETADIDKDVRNIVDTIMNHDNIPRKKPKFVNFVKNILRNRASSHSIDKTWDLFSQALKPPVDPAAAPPPPIEGKQEKDNEVTEQTAEIDHDKKSKKKKKKERQAEVEAAEPIEHSQQEVSTESKKEKKKKKKKDRDPENESSEKENTIEKEKSKKRKLEDVMDVDVVVSPKKTKFDWDDVICSVLRQKEGNEMKLNKLKKKCVNEFLSVHEGTHKSVEEIGEKFDKKLKKRKYKILKDRVKLIEDSSDESNSVVESKVEEAPVAAPAQVQPAEKPKAGSFNNWESAALGSDAATEKFRRLMGIKSGAAPPAAKGKFGGSGRDDKKIFRDLEQGFEKARQAHFGGRCFDQ